MAADEMAVVYVVYKSFASGFFVGADGVVLDQKIGNNGG
jgi:hypothetical protein